MTPHHLDDAPARARACRRAGRRRLRRHRIPAHDRDVARAVDHLCRRGAGPRPGDVGDRLGAVRRNSRSQSAGVHRHEHARRAEPSLGGRIRVPDGCRALAVDADPRRDRHLQPRHHAEPCACGVFRVPGDSPMGSRQRRRSARRSALRVLAVHDRAVLRSRQPGPQRRHSPTRADARGRDRGATAPASADPRPAHRRACGSAVLHLPGTVADRGDRRSGGDHRPGDLIPRHGAHACRVRRAHAWHRCGCRRGGACVSDLAAVLRTRPPRHPWRGARHRYLRHRRRELLRSHRHPAHIATDCDQYLVAFQRQCLGMGRIPGDPTRPDPRGRDGALLGSSGDTDRGDGRCDHRAAVTRSASARRGSSARAATAVVDPRAPPGACRTSFPPG